MRTLRLPVLAVTVIALSATHAAAQKVDRAAVQTQVIAAEKAVNDAVMKNDMKTFHSYVAADGLGIDGMGITKVPDYDKMFADLKIASQAISDSQFVWLDDANVVHVFKWTGKGTYQGQPLPEITWGSTIWQNRGGKWTAVFHAEAPDMAAMAAMTAPKK